MTGGDGDAVARIARPKSRESVPCGGVKRDEGEHISSASCTLECNVQQQQSHLLGRRRKPLTCMRSFAKSFLGAFFH